MPGFSGHFLFYLQSKISCAVNHNIIEDLGENYQYVKVIIDNKIEIMKLKFINQLYKKAGNLILLIIIFTSTVLLLLGLLIAFSFWLSTLINSQTIGFLLGFGVLLPINLIIYLFRKQLFYNPIANLLMDQFITNDEENE